MRSTGLGAYLFIDWRRELSSSFLKATIYRNDMARSTGALIGILQGVLSDGQLHDKEIHFLQEWLTINNNAASVWPGSVIASRIRSALADGHISTDEREHLLSTLQQIVGGTLEELAENNHVSNLALDQVATVEFRGNRFVFSGEFAFGPRSVCEQFTANLGGSTASTVSNKVSYLVVGGLGSPEWKHGSFGTKIEKALALRTGGGAIRIVHEDVWAASMPPSP